MKSIAIYVSKKTFVVAQSYKKGFAVVEFNNYSKGFKKFIDTVDPDDVQYVLEATGTYGSLLIYMLCSSLVYVSLVNPRQIKHFSKMMLSVTKSDKLDAKLISMYGEKINPLE